MAYSHHAVKTNHKKKALTFGDFIVGIYDARGRQKAKGIVPFAVESHRVEFRGQDLCMIS
jgi:hypothetical protein